MPRRIKKEGPADERTAIKRLYSRRSYAVKTGKTALVKSIDKSIKGIKGAKRKSTKQKRIDKALHDTSAKVVDEKRREAAKKRAKHETFKGKKFASDIIDDYNKTFGNEFVYEAATMAAARGIGSKTANGGAELVKSTRNRFDYEERLQLLKFYFDWKSHQKEFREEWGVVDDKTLLKAFKKKLKEHSKGKNKSKRKKK